MSRALTTAAVRAVLAHSTNELFLSLLTVTHSSFTTRRFVNDTKDLVSRGNTFTAFPFTAQIPDPMLGEGAMRIDAIDQTVMAALRGASFPKPVALFEVVLRSAPDTVVGTISGDMLGAPKYDTRVVEVRIGLEQYLGEAFPAEVHTPARFPDMFTA